MLEKTALYDKHLASAAKMVEFAGFSLPINYGSQINEHNTVRAAVGMFDVSHMVVSDVSGSGSKQFLSYLLANDVAKLKTEGKALYSCMLNDNGGIIDDLIVYWLQNDEYRIVSNGATRDKDLSWMQNIIQSFDAQLVERPELSILAVQGPKARETVIDILPIGFKDKAATLGRFFGVAQEQIFIGRTGYTGEDGFEIITDSTNINAIWDKLLTSGVVPCGLGARDSLRLEAGMMLYGTDMSEENHPFESALKWTVTLGEREFSGKAALKNILNTGFNKKMVGLILEAKGIMRSGQKVYMNGDVAGGITSGGFSPVLNKSIAFARVDKDVSDECRVKIREQMVNATVGGLDFVKHT